jgi:hypothetical protein
VAGVPDRLACAVPKDVEVDVADVEVGVGEVELDVADVEVGVGEVELDVADVEVGVGEVELDVADVEVDVGEVELDVADVEVGVGEVELDVADVEVGVGEVELDVADVEVGVGEVALDVGEVEKADARSVTGSQPWRSNQAVGCSSGSSPRAMAARRSASSWARVISKGRRPGRSGGTCSGSRTSAPSGSMP